MIENKYVNPKLIIETTKVSPGNLSWQSPSNIALIKYWGKHGTQLPNNPSISFTLDKAYSKTKLSYTPKTGADSGIELEFLFHEQPQEAFAGKIRNYFEELTPYFPFLKQLSFKIESENSFPHSAGIASSASGMSALALCLCSLEDRFFGTLSNDTDFRQKASFIARLGSGSACRSIYNTAAIWGTTAGLNTSSDLYAIEYAEEIHPVFQNFQDTILIINKGEKAVSSRAGHQLMENNIYAESRYQQARQQLNRLLPALQSGDLQVFGNILENEALTLHALMMSSNPPYILMEPQTLEAINKVQNYRLDTGHPLYFTLDAGPNLHLLYPAEIKGDVQSFIKDELAALCQDGKYIEDQVGNGPIEL